MANTGVEYVLSLKDLFTSKIRQATGETEKLNSAVSNVQKGFGGLKTAFAAIGGTYVAMDIIKTTAAFEGLRNQLNFAAGDAIKGGQDLDWIRERAEYLGLDLNTAAQSFAKFSGAARDTSLEGQGVRDIFDGVAKAATTMHLSADEADGTFRALQQMLSKGKVSAEELNGQLGERLPGALGIASRAMGVTQAELMKMTQKGELLSEDFLPKFGAQLRKEFGDASEVARESLSANMNRIGNVFLDLKLKIGKYLTPIIDVIIRGVDFIKRKWDEIVFAVQPFIDEMIYLKNQLVGIGGSFDWASVLKNVFGAIRIILVALQPLIHLAIKGFTVMSTVIIGVVNGILEMINALGRLFGMKQFKLITPAQNAVNLSSSSQALGATNSKGQTSTAKAKGGTSTSAVESRGVQNFNISIKSLVEKLEFTTNNMKESGAVLKEEVAKALIEAVNDFQLMATK
jgi:tape measure domain-containing protein